MILSFFSSRGWESWDVEHRPLIPEGMPVLVDDDLRFEDGPAAPRPAAVVNRWLRELPASGAPAPSSWENYARAVKEWTEFLAEHGVGLFDSRVRLKAVLSRYAEHRAAGPLKARMAYRPGGLLASKIHLKHIAVATTEGYASRPGGAQAELLSEINKHESERNLQLVLDEFRNYQQGILPAGPGARSLTEFFASVDEELDPAAASAPKIQRNDRDVLNLLTKRAKVLHLGPANYCWFTDPSRALCLKLAGTPTASRPLIGMCDAARCPQATHHPCHRPVWAEHAARTETFIGQLGTTRKAERTRLEADHERALHVVAEIDAAGTTVSEESA